VTVNSVAVGSLSRTGRKRAEVESLLADTEFEVAMETIDTA